MDEKEYLENRLEDQRKYYSINSSKSKRYYYRFKSAEISIAVIIPFLTGYISENEVIKYIIGLLSVLLALLTGLEVLYKFHDKWITYRSTAESLLQEKYMFLAKAGPYKEDHSIAVLTERVESILAKENATWNQLMNKEENKKK